ncbi:MAG: crossover junction endodeoxyribonuclease RuvC [Negativicoccus succinicivorans]|nr:crossover junction endodeoxyribonuclease RuvC [Negativicoccus succinicivorans]
MRVLGIDPGTAICGFGVVERNGSRLQVIDYGVLTTPAHTPMPDRLTTLYQGLVDLIEKYQPDRVGVEELFFNKNVTTAITVAQARGVILLAAVIFDRYKQKAKRAV